MVLGALDTVHGYALIWTPPATCCTTGHGEVEVSTFVLLCHGGGERPSVCFFAYQNEMVTRSCNELKNTLGLKKIEKWGIMRVQQAWGTMISNGVQETIVFWQMGNACAHLSLHMVEGYACEIGTLILSRLCSSDVTLDVTWCFLSCMWTLLSAMAHRAM